MIKKIFYLLIPILTFFGIQTVNAEFAIMSSDDIYLSGKGTQFKQDYVTLDAHWMSWILSDGNSSIDNLAVRYSYRFPVSTSKYNVTFTIATIKDIVPVAFLNGQACQPFYSKYVNSASAYYHLINYSCVNLDGSGDRFEINIKGPLQGPDHFLINHDITITRFDDSSQAINGSLNNINSSINSTNSKLDDVNNSLNNSDTSGSQSELEKVNDSFQEDISTSPVSDLITLPLKLLNAFNNKLSANEVCSPYDMGTIFGIHWLQLPCINPAHYLGKVLWATIDMITTALLLWSIAHKMVKVYISITSVDGQFVTKIVSQTGGML